MAGEDVVCAIANGRKPKGAQRALQCFRCGRPGHPSNKEPCEEQHDADVVEDGGDLGFGQLYSLESDHSGTCSDTDTDESNLEPEEDGVQDEQAPASLRTSTRLRQPPQRYGLAYTH